MNVSAPKEVNTTPVFQQNYAAYLDGYSVICNEGGSRSGKTYSIIQLLCGIAQSKPNTRISIVSHSLPHIKRGAYRDFKIIMEDCGWWDDKYFRYTDFVFEFPNGSYIELFGLEDEGKARGPARDILFVNEANLISKMLFDQLAMRTTGTIFLDWNPAEFNSWVYDLADNPKNKKIHSTYLDNIYNLTPTQIEYIESYKELPDDFMWKVYGLGERGASKELIYTAWKIVKELPNKGQIFYGLDFGYTAPTAMVKVEYHEGAIYVEELLYQSKLTASDLVNKLKGLNLSRSDEIYCDSAEPKTIEELCRSGFNAKPSEKDVWGGIMKVKSYPLYITHNSENVKRELQSYKWKVDKDGNIAADEAPVKENDHSLDALRYAVFTKLTKPALTWVAM
ncbi:MAG TPA: terminase large subunit [Chitinophagaceae bacterium]|nr:terminase large subunit [Chitinophagaceae bacterium]